MTTFRIEFSCDNVAFGESPSDVGIEVARILRNFSPFLIEAALETGQAIAVIDANGKRVGDARIS